MLNGWLNWSHSIKTSISKDKIIKEKGEIEMNYIDYLNRKIPDYYDTMYLDGYTPEQILMAHRKMMIETLLENEEETEEILSIIS